MNKFEKWCWNRGLKKSLFGCRIKLNEDLIKLKKSIYKNWFIKKQYRIIEFMGLR